jgi:preprotein translocase SecE subunit
MATDAIAPGAQEPGGRPQPSAAPPPRAEAAKQAKPGFFTIYKKGQGYWTRLLSALGAGLILFLTVHFLWTHLPPWITPAFTPDNPTNQQMQAAVAKARNVTLGICAAVLIGGALLGWRLLNKPENVDFLIATDSEMKKVNWTSRKELIGSTKVVIFFMMAIAFVLFVIDILFGYVFYWFGVLKSPPF